MNRAPSRLVTRRTFLSTLVTAPILAGLYAWRIIEDRVLPYATLVAGNGLVFYVMRLRTDAGPSWEVWVAGADGLDLIRSLIGQAPAWLKPGGLLLMECGAGQDEAIIEMLTDIHASGDNGSRFIAAAKSGQPLKVYGEGQQTRCFGYVRDTIEALVRLQNCSAARGQVFNVGGTEEISILDLARKVIEILRSKSAIEFIPYSQAYEPGFDDMRRRKPVVDKLAATVDFRPGTSLQTIIELTAAAMGNEPDSAQ